MGGFFNGAFCDLYIGKGAGKKLLTDIRFATDSVKIISPYLSPFLIKELIKLNQRNIDIELITANKIEDFYGNHKKNIYDLIIQNRSTDEKAVLLREKYKKIYSILLYVVIGITLCTISSFLYWKNEKILLGIFAILASFLVYNSYLHKYKNTRIYNYWYSQLFPFKVYLSPDVSALSNTFIHSKVYIIDNKIAYLGSLNFTFSGTKSNHETRIKITNSEAVKMLNNEFYDLFNNLHEPEINIQKWGKQLYKEPIN